MKLGFACAWGARPELTWSHTPWSLRAALRERAGSGDELVDLGVNYPPALRTALRAATARRHDGRWVSMWRHSRPARRYGEVAIRRTLRRTPCDIVLQIQDLAAVDPPFLLYQDLSYDVLLERAEAPEGLVHFPTLSSDAVLRLRDRQRALYEQAAGVLAMSRWFADHLVARTGLPAGKVHVVHPGATAAQDLSPATLVAAHKRRLAGPRRRLLFVGKDFRTKAGGQVVAALAVLRRDVDPDVTLTVAGPDVWPLPGEVPAGVRFLGRRPVAEIGRLYDEHDLFVLPSRFEGFGISFVEALAHGLPCVGRDAFAMPEIIQPGVNGDLVTDDDPAGLAGRIAALLADPELYQRTYDAAAAVAEHYSWPRAAADVLTVAHTTRGHHNADR
ncbi:MAG TPA: glycosyltransferase family 4 protein [Mycobacteriales bacterium]|nr:glycosyltransferase family 4 protein [Mycobacteriales bacterium]